jgi:hypothetical protein
VVFPRGSNGGVSRAHHEDESATALLRDSGTTSCFSCRQRARGNGGEGGEWCSRLACKGGREG